MSRIGDAHVRGGIMRYAYSELLTRHLIGVMLVTSGVIVGIFVLIGPMGSHDALTAQQRLAYGALYACAGWPICYSLNVVTLYFLRFRSVLEIAPAMVAVALFAAVPCAAIVYTVESLAHPDYSADAGLVSVYVLVATCAVSCSLLFLYVVYQRLKQRAALTTETGSERRSDAVATRAGKDVPTASAVTTPSNQDGRTISGSAPDARAGGTAGETVAQPVAAEVGVAADVGDRPQLGSNDAPPMAPTATDSEESDGENDESHAVLLQLLPNKLGTDLIFLKSQDHYIEVHTIVGSSLVRIRFMDAVAELGDRGIQVHRSYWVATRHVKKTVRSGKRTLVRLTGGHQVPVSVTYLPTVRAAIST